METEIAGFDWDEGNATHCQKHGLSRAEIELAFLRLLVVLPDPAHSQAEERKRAVCTLPPGRHIFVVFTLRERDGLRLIRPISARYMGVKEVEAYEEANPQLRER